MEKKFRILVRNSSYLFVIICGLIVSSCEEESVDYTKQGQYGDLETESRQGFFVQREDVFIPNPLPCDSTIYIRGQAEEFLLKTADIENPCAQYNFTMIFDEAYYQARSRGSELMCPIHTETDCPELFSFIIKKSVKCEVATNGYNAKSEVIIGIRCLAMADPRPESLGRSSGNIGIEPFDSIIQIPNFEMPHETVKAELRKKRGNDQRCPATWTFSATAIGNEVSNCREIETYEPLVNKAKALAYRVFARTGCMPNCQRDNFYEIVGVKWYCVSDYGFSTPRATIFFKVHCRKPV